MSTSDSDIEELRLSLERLRSLLENLLVRGLRACGNDEIEQLAMHIQDLERAGAAGAASALAELRARIEKVERGSARALILAQTNVRMLERLLTLRVVQGEYEAALAAGSSERDAQQDQDGAEDDQAEAENDAEE